MGQFWGRHMSQDTKVDRMVYFKGEMGGKKWSFSLSGGALNKDTVQSLKGQQSTHVWSEVNTEERKTENERNRERRLI